MFFVNIYNLEAHKKHTLEDLEHFAYEEGKIHPLDEEEFKKRVTDTKSGSELAVVVNDLLARIDQRAAEKAARMARFTVVK